MSEKLRLLGWIDPPKFLSATLGRVYKGFNMFSGIKQVCYCIVPCRSSKILDSLQHPNYNPCQAEKLLNCAETLDFIGMCRDFWRWQGIYLQGYA